MQPKKIKKPENGSEYHSLPMYHLNVNMEIMHLTGQFGNQTFNKIARNGIGCSADAALYKRLEV